MSFSQVTVGDYAFCNYTGSVAYVCLHAGMLALKCCIFVHRVVARSPYAAQDAGNMQPWHTQANQRPLDQMLKVLPSVNRQPVAENIDSAVL